MERGCGLLTAGARMSNYETNSSVIHLEGTPPSLVVFPFLKFDFSSCASGLLLRKRKMNMKVKSTLKSWLQGGNNWAGQGSLPQARHTWSPHGNHRSRVAFRFWTMFYCTAYLRSWDWYPVYIDNLINQYFPLLLYFVLSCSALFYFSLIFICWLQLI